MESVQRDRDRLPAPRERLGEGREPQIDGRSPDRAPGIGGDAFPGEDPGEVIVEMLTGTIRPAAEAVGTRAVEDATALLGAMADRTLADLKAARDLAAE